MAKLSLLLFFLVTNACNIKSEKKCIEPRIKQVYFEQVGMTSDVGKVHTSYSGYVHTLMLDEYHEECFNEYNFIYIADKYLDSVKTNLPVEAITFVKPFNFKPAYDSGDSDPIKEHSIVEIWYNEETMNNKVPEIESVSIWVNGTRKELNNMHHSSRQQEMKYYNSIKNATR